MYKRSLNQNIVGFNARRKAKQLSNCVCGAMPKVEKFKDTKEVVIVCRKCGLKTIGDSKGKAIRNWEKEIKYLMGK